MQDVTSWPHNLYGATPMGMATACVSGAYTLTASAASFGVPSSTVSQAVRRVEGEKPVSHSCMLARADNHLNQPT
jgi:hypothetical protein